MLLFDVLSKLEVNSKEEIVFFDNFEHIAKHSTKAYLETTRKSTMGLFWENSWKLLTIFAKKLHPRCLTGF